ncbi:MAG: signal peptidase I [Trueperaceae bacterium]|nr:signal peptidase I [Trueperaceae bacterium]
MARSDSAKPSTTNPKRKPSKQDAQLTWQQRFWREVRGYAEALVVAYLIVTFLFTTVGVVGSSMRPNLNGGSGQLPSALLTGDRVFIPKYDTWLRRANVLGDYKRGEIVVVREPTNAPSAQYRDRRPFFIKRIVAVPGDRLRIEAGQVYVNDVAVDQSFITASGEIDPDPVDFPVVVVSGGEVTGFRGLSPGTSRSTFGADGLQPVSVDNPQVQLYYGGTLEALAPLPDDVTEGEPFVHNIIIPDNHYFVMGDNRESAEGGSEDSRYFGPVRALTVAGRATAVIWPPVRRNEADDGWVRNWRVLRPPEAFEAVPATQP